MHTGGVVGGGGHKNVSLQNSYTVNPSTQLPKFGMALIGPAVRADFRRLYPANAKTSTCCPSDDNRTKVTNSVTSARSLWWHVGPYFWPADLTRTANPITISIDSGASSIIQVPIGIAILLPTCCTGMIVYLVTGYKLEQRT